MSAAQRAARTGVADGMCQQAFDAAGCPSEGVALVAVGGYGRQELAPYSDLDVVLVHDPSVQLGEWAAQVWYPLWDSGANLDHSVRSLPQMLEQAGADLRVAMGLLDARHLAGDPSLTLRLRTAVLTQWRRDARSRLAELRDFVRGRAQRHGELAHVAIPDLKESMGGLRDATALKGLAAAWLVDVPHADLERCRRSLLDVRDVLHEVAGRGTDRIAPEYWPDLAAALGLDDALAAQRHVRSLGRRLTHLSRLAWQRAEAALRTPSRDRRPQLTPIAPGIALSYDEVVLASGADVDRDPLLLLRAAGEAASRRLILAPSTAARLARDGAPLPDAWPSAARQLLVRLLGAGPGLVGVWETLEETGALERILPEWERVRLLPHASTVHSYTVDRHLVETCVAAATMIRRVSRPDLLLVAALLHDIGKGEMGEHSIAGAAIAVAAARRMGFAVADAETIERLVRHHLLLPNLATTRDPEDPDTVATVVAALSGPDELDLLATLTQADALATSDKAWSPWRATMIRDLVDRTRAAMTRTQDQEPAGFPDPAVVAAPVTGVRFETVDTDVAGTSLVRVTAPDRPGLLADLAAGFALARVSVHAARVGTVDDVAASEWLVSDDSLDLAVLRRRFEAIGDGTIDPAVRLGMNNRGADPVVLVRPGLSARATVLEVRFEDQRGTLHRVLGALAELDLTVVSARVDTFGPQAVDVFYVQEVGAGALSDERAAAAANGVRRALEATPGG